MIVPLEVVAAVIMVDDKILCVQRAESEKSYISCKWEFPGGKIEANESAPQALKREILEELGLNISVQELLTSVDHKYPDFSIRLHAFSCGLEKTNLLLNEHLDYKWLYPSELSQLDWAEADIPIVEMLSIE
jgi:8-oxo-dGTP diphosphatase